MGQTEIPLIMIPAMRFQSAEWDGLAILGDRYIGLQRCWDGTWTVLAWSPGQSHFQRSVYMGSNDPADARSVWLRILATGEIPAELGAPADAQSQEVA